MTLSQTALEQHLSQPFRYSDRVDSTNDVAKAWLAAAAPEGAVVIANEQTRGRGRKGRRWHTPPNVALALSVILKPPEAYLPRLNMVAALSVYDLASEIGCENVGIKWPNDVQVNGKKVSGVLPEAVWEADRLIGAILGIGVNVRIDFSQSELRDTAISLEKVLGRRLDRAQLIATLLYRVDQWYSQIAAATLHSTWKDRLNMLNQTVAMDNCKGIALDATSDGALLIRDENGHIHQVYTGDLDVPAGNQAR